LIETDPLPISLLVTQVRKTSLPFELTLSLLFDQLTVSPAVVVLLPALLL
jgi:hypothetical protein